MATKKPRGRPKTEGPIASLQILQGTKIERLHQIYNQWYGCTKCFLGENRRAVGNADDIVFGEGNPDADVLIIGEAPGEEEEATNLPFCGPSGSLLNQILAMTAGESEVREAWETYHRAPRNPANTRKFQEIATEWRHKEFFITNAVACRPPDNRTPTPVEVKTCWDRLWNIIYIIDPVLIIAAGRTALAAVLKKNEAEILKFRGVLTDVAYDGHFGQLKYPVMPVLHPSFLLRTADWAQKNGYFEKTCDDFRSAMKIVDFLRNQHHGTTIPNRERIRA